MRRSGTTSRILLASLSHGRSRKLNRHGTFSSVNLRRRRYHFSAMIGRLRNPTSLAFRESIWRGSTLQSFSFNWSTFPRARNDIWCQQTDMHHVICTRCVEYLRVIHGERTGSFWMHISCPTRRAASKSGVSLNDVVQDEIFAAIRCSLRLSFRDWWGSTPVSHHGRGVH